MNLKRKAIWSAVVLLLLCLFAAGCGKADTPYQINDAQNYTLSVKYDANGGTFTTNTSVIVDSYDLSKVAKDSSGMAQIALLSPDDTARGNNAFTATKNGYFLAGWYTQRNENGTDSNGNTLYTYSGKWDFAADRLRVDPQKTYTSVQPEITLYAAWIPVFQIEYYALDSGELLNTVSYNPVQSDEIMLPQWNESTGKLDMNDVPARENYTFTGMYLDKEGTQAVADKTITHTGVIDYETASAENTTMKLYTDWTAGEWYHIYTVDQFLSNASLNGSYVIHADLDFAGKIWPTVMMYGTFTGEIQGNGHTLSNISVEQTNNSKLNAGLFGQLSETAMISDLTIQNATFTVKSGTRMAGTAYGLLAGVIADNVDLSGLHILSSTLRIDSGCYFGTDDYSIGLVCGMGNAQPATAQISCVASGNNAEKVQISVTDGTVTVAFTD